MRVGTAASVNLRCRPSDLVCLHFHRKSGRNSTRKATFAVGPSLRFAAMRQHVGYRQSGLRRGVNPADLWVYDLIDEHRPSNAGLFSFSSGRKMKRPPTEAASKRWIDSVFLTEDRRRCRSGRGTNRSRTAGCRCWFQTRSQTSDEIPGHSPGCAFRR